MTMSRREWLAATGTGAMGLLASRWLPSALAAEAAARRPNIVLILIDDMGWRDSSCYGSKFYETPNLDRLATEGMRFTNAYAAAPNCAPSRACLLTGLYSPRHGIYTVGPSEQGRPAWRKLIPTPNTTVLDPKFITIAEQLHHGGYVTASIGKWHLGKGAETGPQGQGFDVNVAGGMAGAPPSYFSPYKLPELTDGPAGEYLTDRLTDEALRFLDRQASAGADRPFFLYLPHYAVHMPIQSKAEITAHYKDKPADRGQSNAKYAGMVQSADESIGRVLAKLDELKLADNTLVMVTSDNGGRGAVTDNRPLRGSKGMPYEGGIREPLIVRWPGKVKAGSTCNTAVTGVDFCPTILAAAGVETDARQPLDGQSFVPLLTGEGTLASRAIFWHLPVYLQPHPGQTGWRCSPCSVMRMDQYKLIEFFEDGHLELYDLDNDLSETNDLSQQMPEKTRELHEVLVKWRQTVNAPVPTELNPAYDPAAKVGGSKAGKAAAAD